MKRILLICATILTVLCTINQCNHIHDENCGYDPETGEGCTHICEFKNGMGPREKLNPNE